MITRCDPVLPKGAVLKNSGIVANVCNMQLFFFEDDLLTCKNQQKKHSDHTAK